MIKQLKNNRGFGTIELLLTLIVIILLVFVGWYIYHTDNKSSTTTSVTTTTKTTTPTNETSADAATRAVSIITAFNTAVEGSQTTQGVSPSSYVDGNVSNGYFTSTFKTAVDDGTWTQSSGEQGVSCTNNFPGEFGEGTSTLSGSTATVLLTLETSSGTDVTSQYSQVPQVTLDYVNGNWAVNNLSCITNPS
jgi:uncharacterized protein (UPF0333 family)